jgi:hypothetical protein
VDEVAGEEEEMEEARGDGIAARTIARQYRRTRGWKRTNASSVGNKGTLNQTVFNGRGLRRPTWTRAKDVAGEMMIQTRKNSMQE